GVADKADLEGGGLDKAGHGGGHTRVDVEEITLGAGGAPGGGTRARWRRGDLRGFSGSNRTIALEGNQFLRSGGEEGLEQILRNQTLAMDLRDDFALRT